MFFCMPEYLQMLENWPRTYEKHLKKCIFFSQAESVDIQAYKITYFRQKKCKNV